MKTTILGLYFRAFLALTRYSCFMADRAVASRPWRFLFRTIQRALSLFYSGTPLSLDQALALASRPAQKADCICAAVTHRQSPGACYYLGDWGRLYAAQGPCPSTPVSAEVLRQELCRASNDDRLSLMTVSQSTPCAFFPERYVICACESEACLPERYQRLFPDLDIRRERRAGSGAQGRFVAHLRFFLAVPVFAVTFALFRLSEAARWKRILTWSSLLFLLALLSGVVISHPGMWPYLHNPASEWNRFWMLLLPPGVFLEAATAGALLWALLAGRGRKLGTAELAEGVLPAFVVFQGVHLLRFLATDLVRDRWALAASRAFFWSFDPFAWGLLALLLYRLLRRLRGIRPASPAPGGQN